MNGPAAIDFETTDKDPLKAEPIEVALYNDAGLMIQEFIKPVKPIPPETSAIHHIVDADVKNARPWQQVRAGIANIIDNLDPCILIAHNADYERAILGSLANEASWICTYKCALRVWPDAPSHKNEVLRYYLGLGDLGRSASNQAHTALHDCRVTFSIFAELLKKASLQDLLKWSIEPKHFPRIPFGKYAGTTWDKIPGDYLHWMVKQVDMDIDILECAGREIMRRRNNAATRSD